MKEIKLSALIPPTFRPLYGEIKRDSHLEYWLKGGRGSGKSSFVSLVIILGMMRITYLPTGQRVVFRGLDNAKKVKSAKLARGYFKYVWFEELSEFSCHEEMRGAMQTFVRGGEKFAVFASYNPPRSVKSWVNAECALPKSSRYVHHSTYLDVLAHPDGAAWLGEAFVLEARHQERQNPALYAHEYLGEASGTGGEVFANVTLREIAGKEAAAFDRLHFGIDWGYAVDPFCFVAMHYDAARRTVFIFDEIFCSGLSNRSAATSILARHPSAKITADCAEPKSIDELNSLGLHVRGAKKRRGLGRLWHQVARIS